MVIGRYPPTIGGTELQCRELSRILVKRGHQVSVLTEQNDSSLPQNELQEGVAVVRFPVGHVPLVTSVRYFHYLGQWLKSHPEVELIHAHMLAGPAMAAFAWGKILKKPVVLKIAGAGITGDIGTSRQRPQGHLKLALFKRWTGLITCPSAQTFGEIAALGIPQARLRVIPNGVRADRFKPVDSAAKIALRKRMGIPDDALVALYAGRWAEGKGLDTLLDVWEKTAREGGFPWHLHLVISTPPPEAAKRRLEALGDRVRIFVRPEDPVLHYQIADLAVLLSENEGMSNFLLEAMSCGLPLLTTQSAQVDTPEKSTGWSWLAPRDFAAIRELFERIAAGGNAMLSKGSAARHKVLETFAIERIAEEYERMYQQARQGV